ncbi:MAG: 16S rRNA (adenine(1518)-N(6)/adenine(1519)-N(6))-dimethyltransferase RsmA [Burkholderiaceae bacterium]
MRHLPKKRFGQNFLHDASVLQQITDAINPSSDDLMVEIGPGKGAMTSYLLPHLKALHVVELDRDLISLLEKQFRDKPLTIHSGDALQFKFDQFIVDQRKLRIVGNLPYNISTPLLFHLAQYVEVIEDQHFMLQREVVERMVAEPGGRDYGRLSVMLQWRYDMTQLFVVPPQAFDPPPKVESAIVRMMPIRQPPACEKKNLEQVVTAAFSQRRKVIRNSLGGLFTEQQLTDAGIDPQARPETVSVDGYVRLAQRLAPSKAPSKLGQ